MSMFRFFKRRTSRSASQDMSLRSNNSEIVSRMREDQERQKRVIRILLLGAGESGKSTVLKQMKKIHRGQISERELRDSIQFLYDCVLRAMITLCKQSKLLADEGEPYTIVDPSLESLRSRVARMEVDGELNESIVDDFEVLWADPGILQTWELRSRFQLQDNVDYLFARMRLFVEPNYIPTFDDYLRIRVRSTGFNHEEFELTVPGFAQYSYFFQFTDVGGQRSERKKWMRVLDNVSAILYCVAVSEYDQMCFEDWRTNRLEEAIQLFEKVVQMDFFTGKTVVLFFNKIDLFDEKIQRVPFTTFPEEYEGDPHDRSQVIDFLARKFSAILSTKHNKPMHVHLTCATDTNNIQRVFQDIQVDLVKANLESCGLI